MDTAAKRASAVNVSSPWRGSLPFPDGAIDQGDRQTVAFMYAGILAGEFVEPPVVESGAAGGFGPTRSQWRRMCKEWEEVERLADKLEDKAQEVTGKRRTALDAAAQAAHEAADQLCTDEDNNAKEADRLAELLRGALRAVSLSQTVKTANAAKAYAIKVTEDEEDDDEEMAVILRLLS